MASEVELKQFQNDTRAYVEDCMKYFNMLWSMSPDLSKRNEDAIIRAVADYASKYAWHRLVEPCIESYDQA